MELQDATRTSGLFREVNLQIRNLMGRWPVADGLAEFICECADSDCAATLPMDCAEFDEVARNPGRYIVSPDHGAPPGERVTHSASRFLVVERASS